MDAERRLECAAGSLRRIGHQALSRLSAEATAQQRREVEQLAGALFDEQQALQARQRLLDESHLVIDRTRTAAEQHAAEVAKLNELLQAGAIDQATYARAVEDWNDRALRSSQAGDDRHLVRQQAGARKAAAVVARRVLECFSGTEDALVGFISTGKLQFQGPERVVREEKAARELRPIRVVVNVTAADANSFRASQGQIAANMARAIDRASRNR